MAHLGGDWLQREQGVQVAHVSGGEGLAQRGGGLEDLLEVGLLLRRLAGQGLHLRHSEAVSSKAWVDSG